MEWYRLAAYIGASAGVRRRWAAQLSIDPLGSGRSVVRMSEHVLRRVGRKSGAERLRATGFPVGATLLDFWQWSSSDLLSSTLRGHFAEFVVAAALGVADATRVEWDPIDLVSPSGVKIEVKSSAYVQSWRRARSSQPKFDIRPRRPWDWEKNDWGGPPGRYADVYVFCLLAEKDPANIDPTDLDQWRFLVLPTKAITAHIGSQKTVGLSRLRSLGALQVAYSALVRSIETAAKS